MKNVLEITLSGHQDTPGGEVELFFRNTESFWRVGNIRPNWKKKRRRDALLSRIDTVVEMAQEEPEAIPMQRRNIDIRVAWQRG